MGNTTENRESLLRALRGMERRPTYKVVVMFSKYDNTL